MRGPSRSGSRFRRAFPFALSLALVVWAAFGPDLFQTPRQPLRIAIHDWVGYAPFQRAADTGLLDRARIQLFRLSSAPAVGIGLDFGTLDGVALTMDETLRLIEERKDLRVILVIDESVGSDAIVAKPGIADLASLRGRRVGFEPNTASQFLLSRALEMNGIGMHEIESVTVPIDQHMAEWRAGHVDALATFEPVMGPILSSGAKVLFDSRQLPGEIVDVLVVRADLLQERAGDLKHLIHAWFAALQLDRSPGSETEAALAHYSGQSIEDTRRSLQGMRFPSSAEGRQMITGPSPLLLPRAMRIQAWLRDSQFVAGDIAPSVLFGPDVDALYEDEP